MYLYIYTLSSLNTFCDVFKKIEVNYLGYRNCTIQNKMKQMMMNRRNSHANMFGILSETPRYERNAKKSFVPRIYSKKELQMQEKLNPSLPYKKIIATLPKHFKWKLPVVSVRNVHTDDGTVPTYSNERVGTVTFDDHYDPLPEDFDRMLYLDKMDEIKEAEYDDDYQYDYDQEYIRHEQEYDDYDEYDRYDKYENDYFD